MGSVAIEDTYTEKILVSFMISFENFDEYPRHFMWELGLGDVGPSQGYSQYIVRFFKQFTDALG